MSEKKKCTVDLCGFEGCTKGSSFLNSCCVCRDDPSNECDACKAERFIRKDQQPHLTCWSFCLGYKVCGGMTGGCMYCTVDLEKRVDVMERRLDRAERGRRDA